MTQQLPPKKEVALALLERSNVDVYLDPRAAGVVVPPQFRKEPRLILKIGLNMPVPIPDLRLDEESLSCTLSFSRTPFYCVVPWSSVFAMVGDDGRGMVWPDDVPQELAVRAGPQAVPDAAQAREKPALAAVPPPAESTPSEGAPRRGKGRVREAGTDDVAAGSRPAGAKRSRKKKEAPRPVLVSVKPEAARDVAPAPEPTSLRKPPPENAPPPSAGPPTSQRPKRELPPYLRVVK